MPQCPVGAGVLCCFSTCVWSSSVPVSAGLGLPVWELGGVPVDPARMEAVRGGGGGGLLATLVLEGLWQRKSFVLWASLWCQSGFYVPLLLSCKRASWDLGRSLGLFGFSGENKAMPCTLVRIRRPSLLSDDTYMVLNNRGALGERNSGQTKCDTSFLSSPPLGIAGVFLVCRT